MGLLDDAIRQHLELKRQHGADPGDVAEQEREAFGPIKRGDLDVGTGAAAEELLHENAGPDFEDAEVDAPAEAWADEPASAPAERELPPLEPVAEPAPASGSVVLPDEPAPPEEPEPFEAPADEPFAPTAAADAYTPAHTEPAPPAPPVEKPVGGFEDIGEPTQEYSVLDDAPDPQPDPATGERDELEETPDFLEETPEHDRLWFEQKPPRDFDF